MVRVVPQRRITPGGFRFKTLRVGFQSDSPGRSKLWIMHPVRVMSRWVSTSGAARKGRLRIGSLRHERLG